MNHQYVESIQENTYGDRIILKAHALYGLLQVVWDSRKDSCFSRKGIYYSGPEVEDWQWTGHVASEDRACSPTSGLMPDFRCYFFLCSCLLDESDKSEPVDEGH